MDSYGERLFMTNLPVRFRLEPAVIVTVSVHFVCCKIGAILLACEFWLVHPQFADGENFITHLQERLGFGSSMPD
jgi:hypothetical protein